MNFGIKKIIPEGNNGSNVPVIQSCFLFKYEQSPCSTATQADHNFALLRRRIVAFGARRSGHEYLLLSRKQYNELKV